MLHLDDFFISRLLASREGTQRGTIVRILAIYGCRLLAVSGGCIDTGSPRQGCQTCPASTSGPRSTTRPTAPAPSVTAKHDRFGNLRQRWSDQFESHFEGRVCDLSSTHFACAILADTQQRIDKPTPLGNGRAAEGGYGVAANETKRPMSRALELGVGGKRTIDGGGKAAFSDWAE